MLQEALEVFGKKLAQNDRIVFDSYVLKDGTYRLIEICEGEWQIKKTLDIFYDKKSKEVVGKDDEDFYFIKQLDYYSKLLEMNKPIDSKKVIHTNNYFAIAVKKENIVSKKLTQDVLKQYYDILKKPISKYEKKSKAKKLYEKVEENLGQVDIELVELIKKYVFNHDIFEGIDLNKKNYAKVFFVFPEKLKTLESYKKENERYLLPNLYNSNDYNVAEDEKIFGLPNNNMGMNAKKPFLESKTKKIKVPYLLEQKQALLQMYFFDYLWGKVSQRQYDFYFVTDEGCEDICSLNDINEFASGYYIRCQKEKNEVKIVYADNVVAFSKNLDHPFVLKNYISIPEKRIDKSDLNYDVDIDGLWQIADLIDKVFFDGKLKYNFYSDIDGIQINDSVLKRCLLENRNILLAWFYVGKTKGLKLSIDKFSLELVLNSLRNEKVYQAQHQLNLRWSLLEYFEKGSIGEYMNEIREQLRKHINLPDQEEWCFENDEEFAYAVGQVVYCFATLNKSNNKSQAFINSYLNAKSVDNLKKKITVAYKKYNYLITLNGSKRISELITHIMTYQSQKIDVEYIIAGFTATSLIFEKKQEENEDE